jgi:hypothetical protein
MNRLRQITFYFALLTLCVCSALANVPRQLFGHASSMDLYSFCNGDPLNKFDPTGRFGKQIADSFSQIGDSSFDSRNINFGSTWFDQLQDQSRGGDLVSSYNQTQAQMSQMQYGLYQGDDSQSGSQAFSSMVDAVPLVGGLKMWWEMNSGSDLITGQAVNGNQSAQAAGILLNFAAVGGLAALPEEEALNSGINLASGGAVEGTATIDANAIRFSQSSVKPLLSEYVEQMKAGGWFGEPIDVVRMPDGGLTSIDNTRLAAASITQTPVQANIWQFGDAFPASRGPQFFDNAQTWGEAVLNRIGSPSQNPTWQALYPNGSPFTGIRLSTLPINP